MDAREFERLISSVADQMSAPDYFPANMPENDLHPDPARLSQEIVSLRHRVTRIEQRLNAQTGLPDVIREFPRRE